MGKLVINQNFVTDETVKELEKVCPFNAFDYDGEQLSINASCKNCKQCIKRGPSGVITYVEEKEVITINKDEWVGLTVFVELEFGKVHPVVYELIGKAKELAEKINHPLYAIMIASKEQIKNNAEAILSYGVDKLFVYQDEIFENFNTDRAFSCMKDFIEKIKPSVILYGGTALGRSFAPKVAAYFKTGLTADCTSLGIKDNTDLVQVRPAFGGNIMAQIVSPDTRPQFCTARYKVFNEPKPTENVYGEIVKMDASGLNLQSSIEIISSEEKPKDIDISEADVIVVVGRGAMSEGMRSCAKELADLLGGVVACSRPLVEANIYDAKHQIGLSGRTVKPKFLICLAVSGAVQFAAGMKSSDCIVAINTDKTAPIFDVAHYAIVGDVNEIIPRLINKIKEVRADV